MADSKPVKQEVNGTVIRPPLVFPGQTLKLICSYKEKGFIILALVVNSKTFVLCNLRMGLKYARVFVQASLSSLIVNEKEKKV